MFTAPGYADCKRTPLIEYTAICCWLSSLNFLVLLRGTKNIKYPDPIAQKPRSHHGPSHRLTP